MPQLWLVAMAAKLFFVPTYMELDFPRSSVNVRCQHPLVLFFLLQLGRVGFLFFFFLQLIYNTQGNHKTFFQLVPEEENLMVFKELNEIEI